MQVANALNNHIRILFNPKVESFKLFDFLIVKSDDDRYLAQITEIYEDKFDASQNVAKLKLFYKIGENNEVMPYDSFTPNKECEIIKVRQEEIEDFINQDKETFPFAINAKDKTVLNMQFEFFENNPIILADKVEQANTISINLASNLSKKRHVVLIDSTGVIDFEGAKKIKASKNFKMPLNYFTLDFVFEECLKDSTLEFQAIGTEIINEIKKFARNQEGGFIPFSAFAKVLLEQYKVTPYPELRLLLARVKKLQMDEIFARTKKDNEALSKALKRNKRTVVDLSKLSSFWQKAYLEYVISELKDKVYLILRINGDTLDVDLINKIYNQKKNIYFIPNVSYNYKKLPSVIQNCKNYILMPSLYQRNDFLDANFALSNLINEGCIIFGENTDNFLYIARDIEAKIEEAKKNYRKISLSIDNKKKEQPIPIVKKEEPKKPQTDSEKLINELKDFKAEQKDEFAPIVDRTILNQNIIENKEEPSPEPSLNEEPKEEPSKPDEVSAPVETKEEPKEEVKEEPKEENKVEETFEKLINSTDKEEPIEEIKEEVIEPVEIIETETNEEETINEDNFENILLTEEQINILDDVPEEINNEPKLDILNAELVEFGEETSVNNENVSNAEELSDEELDFFEIAKESSKFEEQENVIIDNVEYKTEGEDIASPHKKSKIKEPTSQKVKEAILEAHKNVITSNKRLNKEVVQNLDKELPKLPDEDDSDEDIDLLEVANKSIDSNFKELINEEHKSHEIVEPETSNINNNQEEEKPDLPIYTEEQTQDNKIKFSPGDIVVNPKYGKGTVLKIVQKNKRQLLQIEFETGKKLLDPNVTDIKPE